MLEDAIDTENMNYTYLKNNYGQYVADLVQANTVNSQLDKSIRKQEVVDRCIAFGEDATIIMATEILDGLEYYLNTNNDHQLQNKIKKAQYFIQQNPYQNKATTNLIRFCDTHQQ